MARQKLTRGEVKISKLYLDLMILQHDTFEEMNEVVDEDTLYASRLLLKEFKRLYLPYENTKNN